MADVLCVGCGPVGSAYVRAVLDAITDARIVIVGAGAQTTDPPASHVKNNRDDALRASASLRSQGPDQVQREVVSVPERGGAYRAGFPERLLDRPGLYLIEGEPHRRHGGLAAASAIACVGGLATQWTAACSRPSGSAVIPFLESEELKGAFSAAERYLAVSNSAINQTPRDVKRRGIHVRRATADDKGGGGLFLVAQLADRWGTCSAYRRRRFET
ncbi:MULTISPECIES: hypothetical protein [Streptomyces]|uniref:Uncharacterized protein n=1 Tax=Streptomyces rhizosphaericus TaxID=114699 RepID=A0A6G4AWZ2_9ACTN|nr:hypothetical protein [Streptomyces rhizosphaericus]NEW77770.1 hypothetical protein [Streptomyces rhizosphaericus]